MTPSDAVILTRYVAACCPQQAIDEYTPDAWYDLLGDLELGAAKAAVMAVARRQPFVAPAEIRAELAAAQADDRGPQSNACRDRNCRDCVWSWCVHTCHRRAVDGGQLAIGGD